MQQSDIFWNDEARAKILDDSDRVLREAVLELASTHADSSWEDLFAELHARLKDRFIDFEPGPDLRKYAEAIANGEFADAGASAAGDGGSDAGDSREGASEAGTAPTEFASTDPAVNSTGTADGVQASLDNADEVVNDG